MCVLILGTCWCVRNTVAVVCIVSIDVTVAIVKRLMLVIVLVLLLVCIIMYAAV